jgi:photosystem II stability/assembly factor-like uncharacterized protein
MPLIRPSRPHRWVHLVPLIALLAVCGAGHAGAAGDKAAARSAAPRERAAAFDPAQWKALHWREVGPYRGGRSAAVTGIPGDAATYYFGATGGGVWKTADGGRSWANVSDGFFGGSIGAVAVSEWDKNVVYAGGGEVTVRGNVSHGEGVWKSTDAGKSWKFAGLADSRQIPRLRIHPKNPDLVYAAVLGHLFGRNEMRGVYRSRDGGANWERVLSAGDQVGAVDLAMDPTNPRVLYAGLWRVRRTPYSLESGGPGSGLWKSADGGDTWTDLTGNPGLPKGTIGIVGVTVSPTNPENVYAILEAEDGGVFRSRDGGKTWTRTNEDRALRQRAWYYSRIYADPGDEESVYVVNVQFQHSKDGGRTFSPVRVPHGDNHDLWLAPEDPRRMIEANDGGANVSADGGRTWTGEDNQPTAQIYRVSTDDHFPYRIYGAQQDNTALRIASRSSDAGIGARDWEVTAGGESGTVVADPADPEVVYGGSYGGYVARLDHRTGDVRDVNPWPDNPMGWGAADLQYRFQWNFPLFFSPHPPHALYAAANVLFKSTDGGQSWQPISPDLTRNDKSKQGPSGGPITKDNTSIEYYDTIFTAVESPLAAGVLWAGSDDGLLHLSRDGGQSWHDVTPRGLPEWSLINSVEASPFDAGGLYVAATRYKWDDFRPYLYKTADYGATWTRIDQGIAPAHFTRVVRADPVRRGLLYAGTERGVYVSWDDGGHWQPLQLNLPIVPVTDLAVKGGDLIAATQGRGFWVLDDLTPLRELPADLAAKPLQLFTPPVAYRFNRPAPDGGDDATRPPATGENPPDGVVVSYYLRAKPAPDQEVKLEFLAADGTLIRGFTRPVEKPAAGAAGATGTAGSSGAAGAGGPGERRGERRPGEADRGRRRREEPVVPAEAGLNRFAWDLSYPAAADFPGMILWGGAPIAPLAAPGSYRVRLTVGGESATAPFEIRPDPRSAATTREDLQAQQQFLLAVHDKLTATHDAVRRIREVRAQLDALKERLAAGKGDEHAKLLAAAKALDEKMTAVEEALYQTKNRSPQDPLNFPIRLDNKLNGVATSVAVGNHRPTAQAVAVRDALVAAIDVQLAKLAAIWDHDLPAFDDQARAENVSAVVVPPAQIK